MDLRASRARLGTVGPGEALGDIDFLLLAMFASVDVPAVNQD
jgi:hypothetical protein